MSVKAAGGLSRIADIWGNAVGGLQCRRGGNPHLRHCRISTNERYGVLVAEQGEGFFEHCQIFDNARMGVTISQHSKPRFSGCQIFDNHGEGVEISAQGGGRAARLRDFQQRSGQCAGEGQVRPAALPVCHSRWSPGRLAGHREFRGTLRAMRILRQCRWPA